MTKLSAAADLLAVLTKNASLSETAALSVREFMQQWSVSAFDAILECHVYSEQRLAEMIASSLGLPTLLQITPEQVSIEQLRAISYRDARSYGCIALAANPGAARLVAIADPSKPMLQSMLTKSLGNKVEYVVAPLREITRAIDEYYPLEMQLPGMCQRQ